MTVDIDMLIQKKSLADVMTVASNSDIPFADWT